MNDIDVVTIVVADGLDELLMDHPEMSKRARQIMSKVLRAARGRISKDSKSAMENDPRHAYKAIKYAVYKRILGGNVSILNKRKASNTRVKLNLPRKLDQTPNQRGGNRIKRNEDDGRNRLASYYGSDRGFVLRFINSGTVGRRSRFGNRGSIPMRDWFGRISTFEMDAAAEQFADLMAEEIEKMGGGPGKGTVQG